MLIQTFDKGYLVIRTYETKDKKTLYICRETKTDKEYMIIRLEDQEIIPEITEFIYNQVDHNSSFTDLSECFIYEGFLHIVFVYNKGNYLGQMLEDEELSLRERLEITEKILEKIILQNMPDYFLCQCLKIEKIVVNDSFDIGFQYGLEDVENNREFTIIHSQTKFAEVVLEIFSIELSRNVIEPIKILIEKLFDGEFKDFLEIYEEYREIFKKVLEIPEEELKKPKTWLFSLWDKIMNHEKQIKLALMVIVFIVVFTYMTYEIRDNFLSKGENKIFEYIGTVKIK